MTLTDTLWLALVLLVAVAVVSGISAWRDHKARQQQALLDRRSEMRRKRAQYRDEKWR